MNPTQVIVGYVIAYCIALIVELITTVICGMGYNDPDFDDDMPFSNLSIEKAVGAVSHFNYFKGFAQVVVVLAYPLYSLPYSAYKLCRFLILPHN